MTDTHHDIFVSYRRADRELVAAVSRRLETHGVRVWYDADIEGGADSREALVAELERSHMLAIFFSEASNESRQLKQELAVADALGKPVVPILIEDTQPRGAYLNELADRTWIAAWPDPMNQVEAIVSHLAALAGKPSGEPSATQAETALQSQHDEAPSVKIADYTGRFSASGKSVKALNDIPPFRWIDLAFLAPAWIGIAGWRLVTAAGEVTPNDLDRQVAFIALLCLAFASLYGTFVFPVRYFLRRRRVLQALLKYLATSLLFFVAGAGIMLAGMDDGYMASDDMMRFLRWFGVAWGGFTLVAFAIYGVLAGQRAIRAFRSNLRKL